MFRVRVRVLNWPRELNTVCTGSLKASAQRPGMIACCPTLPLSLCHQPSVPGTLCIVLMVIKGQMDRTWALHGQIPPTHGDHSTPPYLCPSQS